MAPGESAVAGVAALHTAMVLYVRGPGSRNAKVASWHQVRAYFRRRTSEAPCRRGYYATAYEYLGFFSKGRVLLHHRSLSHAAKYAVLDARRGAATLDQQRALGTNRCLLLQ